MMTKRSEYRPYIIGKEIKKYHVTAHGKKITPSLVTYTEAKMLLDTLVAQGYDKVIIESR